MSLSQATRFNVSSGEETLPGAAAIVGQGEMAALVRAHDWGATELGIIPEWPEALVGAVNLVLPCRFPCVIFWGPNMLQFYNDAYLPLMAEKHPRALGQSAPECWREAWHLIGPEFERALDHGESTYRENVLVPVMRDGRVQDIYWTYSYSPIAGHGGTVAGVLIVCKDVTGEILAKRERDAVGEQLAEVMEATTDGIASIDRSWCITYMNERAKQIVEANGDPVGKHLWETFPGAVYEGSPYLQSYYRAMDERVSGGFEAFYPEPLNIMIQQLVKPSRDGIVVFFRDVTAQKRAEAALIQSEKLAVVGRLASSIAHEINNPLESVTNLIYLARTSGTLTEENQEYLDLAERELRRISLITNQTLSYQRRATSPLPISCLELIEESLRLFQGRIVTSRVVVEKRRRAIQPIKCFDGEIRQVLNNIMGNALDAMHPTGGRLLVRSREGTNWVTGERGLVLTFADTGGGMSAKTQQHIFDPFFTTKGIGGTGLGLWVCQEIIARHHGVLRVRSRQGEGRSGTVFTLFLPFAAAERMVQAEPYPG